MGRKVLLFAVLAVSAAFLASGCSTVPKKTREEISGIKSKVDTLESRVETVESKQAEAERMVSQQNQELEDLKSQKSGAGTALVNYVPKERPIRSKEHTKEIQLCLKNAGFYKGKIDGVKGRGTKKAIKEFQKANGLKADGVVGAKTWEALSRYGAASAPDAVGAEEGTSVK